MPVDVSDRRRSAAAELRGYLGLSHVDRPAAIIGATTSKDADDGP
jgi:hypothetical protein